METFACTKRTVRVRTLKLTQAKYDHSSGATFVANLDSGFLYNKSWAKENEV